MQRICTRGRCWLWETSSLVEILEGVRTLLAYSAYKGFKVYQMDAKSPFLNGIPKKEVYVDHPKILSDHKKKNMVCKLHKALYGLKQEPRAWHERLLKYLVKIGFERTDNNSNLYIKTKKGKGILLSEFFVDDIIFGGQDALCKDFSNKMKLEFEMSIFGEIKFFVGLQIYHLKYDIFII